VDSPGVVIVQQFKELIARLTGREFQPEIADIGDAMEAMQRGIDAANSGRYKVAIQIFTVVIAAAPNTAGVYQHRGSAFAESGNHDAAIIDYDVSIRLNPSYPDTYLDRGNSYYARNEFDKSIKDYTEALRLNPRFGEAYANRAATHVIVGDEESANADIQEAHSLGIDRSALNALIDETRRQAN